MNQNDITRYPLVSIVFPTWNRAALIEQAIDLIMKQTYQNFEILVVDDGSEDNTTEVIHDIMARKNDPRIRFIPLAKHEGGAEARAEAMRQARGEFICSQDDDDEWDPTYIEKQVKNLMSLPPEYGLSYVSYWHIISDGRRTLHPKNIRPREGYIYGGDIMKKNYSPFQAWMTRKSVIDDVGLPDRELMALSDWDMWIRISKKYKVSHIHEPLFTWNNTPGSNSSDPKKIWFRINARKRILEKFKDDIIRFGHFPHHMSQLADLLIEAGDIKQARHHLWLGIKNQPSHYKLWLKLASTFLGGDLYQKIKSIRKRTFLKKIKL